MHIRPGSIFSKGLLLISVPVALQLCTVAAILIAQRHAERAEQWSEHSMEVVRLTDRAIATALEGHGAMRGLAVFRDTGIETASRERLRTLPAQLRRLHELVADNPPQQRHLDDTDRALVQYLAWVGRQETSARNGQWDAIDGDLRNLTGKRLIDEVLEHLQEFLAVEQELDDERLAVARSSRAVLHRVIAVFGLMTLPLAVIVAWVYATAIGRRLGTLAGNARAMADGRTLAEPIGGRDEIADLDVVLHQTARRLERSLEAERRDAGELAARAAELARVNAELQYKTQENEIFVYSASHDLRSPLVNLQGFTREIQHGCADLRKELAKQSLPPEARTRIEGLIERDIAESLHFIQTAVTRLSAIIDALLRLSRAGRVEYTLGPIDIEPVVRRVVDALGATIQERQVRVDVGPLPTVCADATALEQIFGNLVGNAVNYLDPARLGHIEIGTATGAAAAPDSGLATVYVRDNGLGIPADHQQKLFVALQRLHGNEVPGEGIGLALVKRVVDRLGGRIWVHSTPGAGSTFSVALPAARVET